MKNISCSRAFLFKPGKFQWFSDFLFHVDKRVSQQFPYLKPIFRIFLQATTYKTFAFLWHWSILRVLNCLINYFGKIFSLLYVEGNSTTDQFISHYSNVPDINFVIVLFIFDNLRTRIQRSSTNTISQLLSVNGPSKITNFCHLVMDQNILGFQVPMDDLVVVKKLGGLADLPYVLFCLFFRKLSSLFSQKIKKIPFVTHL